MKKANKFKDVPQIPVVSFLVDTVVLSELRKKNRDRKGISNHRKKNQAFAKSWKTGFPISFCITVTGLLLI